MADVIRSFIAVKIPATEPLRQIAMELARMGSEIKVIDPEKYHVTLKFLGNIDPKLVPRIRSIMETLTVASRPVDLTVTGLGVFPHLQRPNVLWAGLKGADSLGDLANELDRALESVGFSREERTFQPHLTVARVKAKPGEAFFDLLSRYEKTQFGTAPINQVELLRSDLGPEGPTYTVLATLPLGAPAAEQWAGE